jgi:hypothetical protein
VGNTISVAPMITIKVAASPCRPPMRRASDWCIGYIATARISAHSIRVTNGAKTE